MELYFFGLLSVMALTAIVLKTIFCWTQCSANTTSAEIKKYLEQQKKELSASKRQLVQLEIPMEDMERTSTPVPKDEKSSRTDFHSDV